MRYSAMPMRVPLFHSLAELMATKARKIIQDRYEILSR